MTPDLVARVIIVLCLLTLDGVAQTAERLFFLNNGKVLQGCIYKPSGDGPFPAVVFNQAVVKPLPSDGRLDPFPQLARFYTSHNYVLFAPGRHLTTTDASQSSSNPYEQEQAAVDSHQRMAEVVRAAVATLKAQNYVNPDRVFVTGFEAGATTTLLLAEKPLDVRAYVVFSPGVPGWEEKPLLRSALQRVIKNANAPIFLIQPQNDFSLGPSEVLGKELAAKGHPNRCKVFAPYGDTAKDGHYFALNAPNVWGPDVISFFEEVSK